MSLFDAALAIRFVKIMATPWKDQKAFKVGIIDQNGKLLRKRKDFTSGAERDAFTKMHVLAFNIKRLLQRLPAGRTRLGSLAAALLLLREEYGDAHAKIIQEMIQGEIRRCVNEAEEVTPAEENLPEVLQPGDYVLTIDMTTEIDTLEAGTEFTVTSTVQSFAMVLGVPMFKLPHPTMQGVEVIVSADNLKSMSDPAGPPDQTS